MSSQRSSSVKHFQSRSESSDKEGTIRQWLDNVHEYSGEWNRKGATQEHQGPNPEILHRKLVGLKERLDSGLDSDTCTTGGRSDLDLRLRRTAPAKPESENTFLRRLEHGITGARVYRTATPWRERTVLRADLPLTVRVYRQACKKFRALPLRRVIGQFGRPRIIFTDLCMSPSDVKAACKALLHESSATYIDFSGNSIGVAECKIILQMLSSNQLFTQLRLADNNLSGGGILLVMKYFYSYQVITVLDISGNKLTDRDGPVVANIIKFSPQLRVFHAHHNEFRETAGTAIGQALVRTSSLSELDLSWNHIRQHGAIGIARGLEKNTSLEYVNLGWNGFGYEGCVALSDTLRNNISIEKLDLSCNRIHPPALLELMKGLFSNKVLKILILDRNPLTPSFTSILLEGVMQNHGYMSLQELSLKGVVVDKDFNGILDSIRQGRQFHVEYETSLPVSCRKRTDVIKEVEMRNSYNIEPLRMLYLLKERNRAQDFFHKINKDHDNGLTPDELTSLFKEAGLPVSKYIIDRIMQFMDTDGDGKIDLAEFLVGDKKMKKITRDHARLTSSTEEAPLTQYSRTFRKAHIQQLTSRLQVEETQPQYLSPIASATQSPVSTRRSSLNYP